MSDARECPTCQTPLPDSGPCQNCADERRSQERRTSMLAKCWGGMRAWRDFIFEKMSPTNANRTAVSIAKAWNPKQGNMFIWGPVGAGKTHIAVAAARRFWNEANPYKVLWLPSEISIAAREAMDSDGASGERRFIEKLGTQKLLIIDDIGAEKRTEFMDALLFRIINARDIDDRPGLIVTSNLSLGDIASMFGDDRITSRINRASRIIDLRGERDHRAPRVQGDEE